MPPGAHGAVKAAVRKIKELYRRPTGWRESNTWAFGISLYNFVWAGDLQT